MQITIYNLPYAYMCILMYLYISKDMSHFTVNHKTRGNDREIENTQENKQMRAIIHS